MAARPPATSKDKREGDTIVRRAMLVARGPVVVRQFRDVPEEEGANPRLSEALVVHFQMRGTQDGRQKHHRQDGQTVQNAYRMEQGARVCACDKRPGSSLLRP